MSKIACIFAAHNETYMMTIETLNDLSMKVGVAIDSIMSKKARAEAGAKARAEARASNGLVEENAGAEVFPLTQNSTDVVVSNHPELRVSSSHFDSSSQFRFLDPNISTTKGRKKGKEIATRSGRIKSGLEMATNKRKRICRSCNKLSRHDSRNCPLNPNRRNRDIDSSSSDKPAVGVDENVDSSDD